MSKWAETVADVLHYYPIDRRFEYGGREWFIRRTAALVLHILLERHGEWCWAEDIGAKIYPGQLPDYYRNCITNYVREIATSILQTSAQIENANSKGSNRAGYRIIGEINVIQPTKCPCCGRDWPDK